MAPVKSWTCCWNSDELENLSKKSNKNDSEEKKTSMKRQASEISGVIPVTWNVIP